MAKPFLPDDLFQYREVSTVHCTPGTDVAACAVTNPDQGSDGYQSAIWLVPLDGGRPFQFTAGTSKDSEPKWAPDGSRLAFVSSREDGQPQVHVIRKDGGEARRLTRLKQGVVTMAWSPDAKRLLATAPVAVDPSAKGERNSTPPQDGPQVVWRLPYKSDGIGYLL